MVRRDGRWLVDHVARHEVKAVTRAEEALIDLKCEAVRVMRTSPGEDGQLIRVAVFERARATGGLAPSINVAPVDDDEAWCDTPEAIYSAASRRVIARLLRGFLDRLSITPTELLHLGRHARSLGEQRTVLPTALNQIAALQARAGGVPFVARLAILDGFVKLAIERAQKADAVAAVPRLEPDGLGRLVQQIEAGSLGTDTDFWLHHAASRSLADCTSYGGRLDQILMWTATPLLPAVARLVDELIAGLLGNANLVREILGKEPNLGAALASLADLATGRTVNPAGTTPAQRPSLAGLLAAAPMPETRLVLVERLQRELAGSAPLGRDDVVTERRLLDSLVERLIDRRGLFIGGVATVEAVARRSRRLDVVGGIEDIRFSSVDPLSRISQILELEKPHLGDRQHRAVATYLLDILDHWIPDQSADALIQLMPLRSAIGASQIPADAKRTLLARLPRLEPA